MPSSLLNLTELYLQMYMHTTTVRKRFQLFSGKKRFLAVASDEHLRIDISISIKF